MDRNAPKFIAEYFGIEAHNTGKTCSCCGDKTAAIPYCDLIKDTTREQFFDAQKDFCPKCFFALGRQFIGSSWVFSAQETRDLTYQEVYDYLRKPLKAPYFLALTATFKKRQICYGDGNYYDNSSMRSVVFDQKNVVYDMNSILFGLVETLYKKLNVTKDAILTGKVSTNTIAKMNNEEFDEFFACSSLIEPFRGSNILKLIVTFIQKDGENGTETTPPGNEPGCENDE